MQNLNKITATIFTTVLLSGCFSSNDHYVDNGPFTAAGVNVAVNPIFETPAASISFADLARNDVWAELLANYSVTLASFQVEANSIAISLKPTNPATQLFYPGFAELKQFTTLADFGAFKAGDNVRFVDGVMTGVFKAKRSVTQEDITGATGAEIVNLTPSFANSTPNSGNAWVRVVRTQPISGGYLNTGFNQTEWTNTAAFAKDAIVKVTDTTSGLFVLYKAVNPIAAPTGNATNNPPAQDTTNWALVADAELAALLAVTTPPDFITLLSTPYAAPNPVQRAASTQPVLQLAIEKTTALAAAADRPTLDANGFPMIMVNGEEVVAEKEYVFLRTLTDATWDALFPARSGKCDLLTTATTACPTVGTSAPTTADIFTREAFIAAVVKYNLWAQTNNFKQFLNTGTAQEQATEFAAFFARAAQATNGSSATGTGASAPFTSVVEGSTPPAVAWHGGLHNMEQPGFASPAVGYVDASTVYPAVAAKSYHGRGIFHMQWNTTYGAFSAWLKDNKITEILPEAMTLLTDPELVATNAEINFMSGIWSWMTPQGAKPASQDVLLNTRLAVSNGTNVRGLPELVAGTPNLGGINNSNGLAYRFGALTNVENGGLYCQGSAGWNTAPMVKASYFNNFAEQLNANAELTPKIPTITGATNQWTTLIVAGNEPSSDILQSATCFNQKAYYNW